MRATWLSEMIQRSWQGDSWHGPSLLAVLSGVDCELAAARHPVLSHSIWQMVLHVEVWARVPLEVLRGAPYADITPELDWPEPGETSPERWSAALDSLNRTQRALCEAVTGFDEGRLGEIVPGKDFSFFMMLSGVAKHNVYHAGQIALLKRIFA